KVTLGAVDRGGNDGQIISQVKTGAVNGVLSGGTGGTAVNVSATGSTLTLGGVNTYVGFGLVNSRATWIVNSSQPCGTDSANVVSSPLGGTLRNGNGSTIDLTTTVLTSDGQWNIDGPSGGSITFHRGILKNFPVDTPSPVNLTGTN